MGFGQGFEHDGLSSKNNEDAAIEKLKQGIPNPHLDVWLEAEGSLKKTLSKKEIVKPIKELLGRFTREEFEWMERNYDRLDPKIRFI